MNVSVSVCVNVRECICRTEGKKSPRRNKWHNEHEIETMLCRESYLFHSKDSPCIYIMAANALLFFADGSTESEGQKTKGHR